MDVVISGVGLVHAHARDLDDLRRALLRGLPPARSIHAFDDQRFFPGDARRARRMDRLARYASVSALLALRDAGLGSGAACGPHMALVGGSMFCGLEACVEFDAQLVHSGPDRTNPASFPNTAHNMACARTAIRLGIEGPVFTLASGLSAGLDAVIWGCRLLRAGRAEVVLAGGFERWFDTLEAALASVLPAAEGAARVSGLLPSEGACFFALESAERCRRRGRRARASVLGFAQASLSRARGRESSASGLLRALRAAIAMADGVVPELACVGVHDEPRYDVEIAEAYRELCREGLGEPTWFAYKRILGETFGASGPFAVAAALGHPTAPRGAAIIDGLAWGGAASALLIQPCY